MAMKKLWGRSTDEKDKRLTDDRKVRTSGSLL